jgi:cell division septum initiation protein DivIVA
MSDTTDHLAEAGQEDYYKTTEMRGYNRRRVDEFVASQRNQIRDLEERLSRSLDDNERLRLEVASARQAAASKPAHEEISERVGQILKLADDEAKSQRKFAAEEIAKMRGEAKQDTDRLRAEAKQETDKFRAEAQNQAERMLRAAQEQAENSVASARAEAEKTRNSARSEAERSVGEAHKQAETAVASAKAQAKQVLDEATARATAIHDGAERRLNLLMSRHTEAIRRLTEIRDVVTTLVAGEVSRGSLEDEVEKAVASTIGEGKAVGRPGGSAESRFASAGTAPPTAAAGQPQAAGRPRPAEQGPRTQPTTVSAAAQAAAAAKSATERRLAEAAGPANGQGAADAPAEDPARQAPGAAAKPASAPRPDSEGGRPAGTGEGGARHAAGTRQVGSDDPADSTRIMPD